MKCNKCNSPMADGELICRECGYESPLMEARAKLECVKEKQKNAVLDSAKKPVFLWVSICIALMSVCGIVNCLTGNFLMALPAIFMVIATVGCFCAYFAKDNTALATALQTGSVFDAYNKIVYYLLAGLAALGSLGIGVLGFVILSDEESSLASLKDILQIVIIALVVLGLAFALICLLIGLVHSRRRKYFLALAGYTNDMIYSYKKAPVVGSYIIGALGVLIGAAILALATKSTTIISLISQVIGLASGIISVAGAELILSLLETLLIGIVGGLGFTAAVQIAYGFYYVLSAYWMSATHTAILATRSFVNHENVRRLDLERKTKEEREKNLEFGIRNAECETVGATIGRPNAECETQNEELTSPSAEPTAIPEGESTVGATTCRPNAECETQNKEISSPESADSGSIENTENEENID